MIKEIMKNCIMKVRVEIGSYKSDEKGRVFIAERSETQEFDYVGEKDLFDTDFEMVARFVEATGRQALWEITNTRSGKYGLSIGDEFLANGLRLRVIDWRIEAEKTIFEIGIITESEAESP